MFMFYHILVVIDTASSVYDYPEYSDICEHACNYNILIHYGYTDISHINVVHLW